MIIGAPGPELRDDRHVWVYDRNVAGLTVLLFLGIVISAVILGRRTQAVREVHDEMAQVAWAPRSLVVRNTRVVLLFLVPVVGFIVLLDFGFSHFIAHLL
jgi:preprotein translocase SecE subunit